MIRMQGIEKHYAAGRIKTSVLRGVARALIARPKLILADEPTGNLDSTQGEEIMELLEGLNEVGTTIVQVTHSEKNAAYGQRVIHFAGWADRERGKIALRNHLIGRKRGSSIACISFVLPQLDPSDSFNSTLGEGMPRFPALPFPGGEIV